MRDDPEKYLLVCNGGVEKESNLLSLIGRPKSALPLSYNPNSCETVGNSFARRNSVLRHENLRKPKFGGIGFDNPDEDGSRLPFEAGLSVSTNERSSGLP